MSSYDRIRTPLVAAVNGHAAGAGMTMALRADIIVAAEDAKLGFVFNRRGVVPDADLLWSLPRLIGYSRAMDVLLTGRIFSGAEAVQLGFAARSAPADEVVAVATKIADGPGSRPTLPRGSTPSGRSVRRCGHCRRRGISPRTCSTTRRDAKRPRKARYAPLHREPSAGP